MPAALEARGQERACGGDLRQSQRPGPVPLACDGLGGSDHRISSHRPAGRGGWKRFLCKALMASATPAPRHPCRSQPRVSARPGKADSGRQCPTLPPTPAQVLGCPAVWWASAHRSASFPSTTAFALMCFKFRFLSSPHASRLRRRSGIGPASSPAASSLRVWLPGPTTLLPPA